MHYSENCKKRSSFASLSRIFSIASALVLLVVFARPAGAELTPPAAFVLAADGVTPLTLEQAEILNPDGRRWAVVLGKALFWDQQAGSDGQACASCHFHAGADTRLTNQLNPGFNDITKGPSGDVAFGSEQSDTGEVAPGFMPSGARATSNYTLVPADLPLHKLLDETNRNSAIRTTTNDRISSMGTVRASFSSGAPLGKPDHCKVASETIFRAGKFGARQVEPRNSPPVINAVFNNRNFWDGRANNLFSGVGVFGMRDILGDPNKRLIVLDGKGRPGLGFLQVENASLASQSLAPPVNNVEMSCDGRSFPDVARRLFLTVPLLKQRVDPGDSVLGPYASPLGQGLSLPHVYEELIARAFNRKYWEALGLYRIEDGQLVSDLHGYTQMETNFSMFWGIAIMLYEATLVSDQSEFDSLVASGDLTIVPPAPFPDCLASDHVDPLFARGCKIFHRAPFAPPPVDGVPGVGCGFCHSTPTFSEAASVAGAPFTPFLNPVTDINNVLDIRDLGFANVGLRPVFSDVFLGGTDPYGNPLSFARQYKTGHIVDPFLQRAVASGGIPPNIVDGSVSKLETDGATKIPTVRNIGLTPPYFSWGGYESLRQVLKVYNRGFNRRDITSPHGPDAHGSNCSSGDTSGSGPDGNQSWPLAGPDCNTNTTGLIVPLGLLDCDANGQPNPACAAQGRDASNDDLAALERYLKALTDRRVQCDAAPFDHPELNVVTGHRAADADHDGRADDIVFTFPAVGASGFNPKAASFCIPNAGNLFAPGMQSRSGGARVSIP